MIHRLEYQPRPAQMAMNAIIAMRSPAMRFPISIVTRKKKCLPLTLLL